MIGGAFQGELRSLKVCKHVNPARVIGIMFWVDLEVSGKQTWLNFANTSKTHLNIRGLGASYVSNIKFGGRFPVLNALHEFPHVGTRLGVVNPLNQEMPSFLGLSYHRPNNFTPYFCTIGRFNCLNFPFWIAN